MMRRAGRILSRNDNQLVVRFERAAACGGCHAAKVCGSAKTTDLTLPANGCSGLSGDEVQLELDSRSVLRGLIVTHMLPLAGLLTGMVLASLLGLTDAGIAGLSFAGLGLGFIASRRIARHPGWQTTPQLVSHSSHAAFASNNQESER
ncbi:hypothetical protein GO613_14665 [Azoarcus communis]|uniref:Fis family transcriptional regulator n=1 Tax=Parazoarcus communis SWub3 = DSM 12120 TaxID=1121029 RepID=A0A323UYQ7_9RHOO|nr:SoxR reducing system RseC family protein [Parazoarcus communis]NMG49337.1 hypothetical protein [Parazoarcus communis]NMG69415.1 hypothetical protein [Parazoarcus communis SWub3 = DSM 12120]PZA17361.1 hypothetical protein DNK49_05725 [Azoarcus communis] [Parazoarcus communis SWub3 = DSM 12120]